VRTNTRRYITAILGSLSILLSSSFALAADYSVEVGVDTEAGRDAGSLTCRFDEICSAKLVPLGLSVSVHIIRTERAIVRLDGGDLSCCYFDGATDSIAVDPRKPVSRVTFFKGGRARGALFIENERMGTLYLRFDYR
jgi:hypothetical protein